MMKNTKNKLHHQNLTNREFSNLDIRRLNFTESKLAKTSFAYATAGILPITKVFLIFALVCLLILSAIILSFSSRGIGFLLSDEKKFIAEFVWILLTIIFMTLTILLVKAEYTTTLLSSTILFAGLVVIISAFSPEEKEIFDRILQSIIPGFFIFIGCFTGFSLVIVTLVLLEIIKLHNRLQKKFLAGQVTTILFGIICGNLMFKESPQQLISSILLSVTLLPVVFYIKEKSLAGDSKYLFFKNMAINLSSKIGTTFKKADLTDADFTGAILGNTNFKEANLTRTCWRNARNLHKARVEGTYLENEKIRQLVVTGNGRNQNFDGLDLRGCNLRNADLRDASFIGAKLSEATLEGADLTRAKLAQAQLYGTNLTNAILTGACIQDWAVSLDTQFEGIKCDYIYMRLETKEDPDPWRKPDNRNETFKEGDFTDFIAPIIKTQKLYQTQNVNLLDVAEEYRILDIFHHQGVDPSAAAIAFQKLIEKYPEAGLKVISMEGRGNEKIHFQAQVTEEANRSILSQEYSAIYHQIQAGTYSNLQAFLAAVAEKDQQIIRFQELLENAIQQPKFYVETYQESRGNVTISSVTGNIAGVVGGDVTGMVDVSQGDTQITGDRNIEINKGDYRENHVNDQGSYTEGDAHHNSPPETP
ncbi:pentapeptide repeat-containing protein [Laspinema sp. D1]|uniref:Pentapeptide repeat-containing protein n=1 Tax=Laspinema palackyanum D2a TaxID=2953684 RepID=A0ABT2N0L1_9CYAN|nr:pentapeptide repeat-containing protein [Laspinema sp. D2a]